MCFPKSLTILTLLRMIILFLDELQLTTELTEAANNAAALPSRDVSKEAMYFGILSKRILPGATVLGFSRSGNKEFFDNKSEVYTLVDVDIEDIQETIQNRAKDPEQIKSIFKKIKHIGLNQILFVMKILEHQKDDFENITTSTGLFLTILRGNLAFHNQQDDTGFSQMLKGEDKDLMKKTFDLCKANLQMNSGVHGEFNGRLTDEENWVSATSGIKIPLKILKAVGIFEIPSPSYDNLTLTAQHLSFVEFFASVGIILSSDIKAELKKIKNTARIKAIAVYIWNNLLKIQNVINT